MERVCEGALLAIKQSRSHYNKRPFGVENQQGTLETHQSQPIKNVNILWTGGPVDYCNSVLDSMYPIGAGREYIITFWTCWNLLVTVIPLIPWPTYRRR